MSFKLDQYSYLNDTKPILTLGSNYYLIHQIGPYVGLSAASGFLKNAENRDPGFNNSYKKNDNTYSWNSDSLVYGWISTSNGTSSGTVDMTNAVITLSSSSTAGATVSISTADGRTFSVAMSGVTFNAQDIAIYTGENAPLSRVSNVTRTVGGETIAVPEPATATLSLLALAGLAARRRR